MIIARHFSKLIKRTPLHNRVCKLWYLLAHSPKLLSNNLALLHFNWKDIRVNVYTTLCLQAIISLSFLNVRHWSWKRRERVATYKSRTWGAEPYKMILERFMCILVSTWRVKGCLSHAKMAGNRIRGEHRSVWTVLKVQTEPNHNYRFFKTSIRNQTVK